MVSARSTFASSFSDELIISPRPVIKATGIYGLRSPMARASSQPLIPGIQTSVR
jgi:hypothetical protein